MTCSDALLNHSLALYPFSPGTNTPSCAQGMCNIPMLVGTRYSLQFLDLHIVRKCITPIVMLSFAVRDTPQYEAILAIFENLTNNLGVAC
jgi:hypothetical protein